MSVYDFLGRTLHRTELNIPNTHTVVLMSGIECVECVTDSWNIIRAKTLSVAINCRDQVTAAHTLNCQERGKVSASRLMRLEWLPWVSKMCDDKTIGPRQAQGLCVRRRVLQTTGVTA